MSPDIRKHRGAHPEDRKLFGDDQLPRLRAAVQELSWLLTRDYAIKGAVKLVGDRHSLTDRQRLAVSRAACSDQSRQHRASTRIESKELFSADLIIDGFNLIITIEAALSGGVLFRCRDGCVRDLSSVHGSYRSVNETTGAILLVGESLATLRVDSVDWILDRPVSNSGRLAKLLRDTAGQNGWPWTVATSFNPDREIVSATKIVITADGPLLDQIHRWTNFNRHLIENRLDGAWLIDLS
ncbi:MAG TPA: DUF434 domain-containing protein [Pyrinomonadaceae bacterium]|nr:DUF434 domain-containing protein [Pyrinomonadaceae bacterium]